MRDTTTPRATPWPTRRAPLCPSPAARACTRSHAAARMPTDSCFGPSTQNHAVTSSSSQRDTVPLRDVRLASTPRFGDGPAWATDFLIRDTSSRWLEDRARLVGRLTLSDHSTLCFR